MFELILPSINLNTHLVSDMLDSNRALTMDFF